MQLNATIRTQGSIETHLCCFTDSNQEGRASLCFGERCHAENFIPVVMENLPNTVIPGVRSGLNRHAQPAFSHSASGLVVSVKCSYVGTSPELLLPRA